MFKTTIGIQETPHRSISRSLLGKFRLILLLIFISGIAAPQKASAEFLSLDSIAAWGKFPKFCIDTYRWGDKFFNNYDSTYVQSSGYRFNIKTKIDSWVDLYNFRFDNGYKMMFNSRPSTSMGLWLTYMAVSIGYDMNVSQIFGANNGARKRFDFQFNCALFGAELYKITNDAHMKITRLGEPGSTQKVNIDFSGFHSESSGINLYYFFNHRNYSQAAAFSYSKIQVRSAGSLYAGFSYWSQEYDMDFTDALGDSEMGSILQSEWGNKYRVSDNNYAIKIGYAYNWVFHKGWCLGVSEAPTIGIKTGYINDTDNTHTSFTMSNRLKASIIYNHNKRWFFGFVGTIDSGLIYDDAHAFLSNTFSAEASAGFRFNLW